MHIKRTFLRRPMTNLHVFGMKDKQVMF